jgi:hypothetical protein
MHCQKKIYNFDKRYITVCIKVLRLLLITVQYSTVLITLLFTVPRCRWEDNNKMDLQEVGGGRGDWMELAQDREM